MKKSVKLLTSAHRAPLSALLMGWLMLLPLLAQVPQGINYQAVVRDGSSVLANQIVDVRFTLLADNIEVYQESHSLTTDDQGLIQTVVGSGTPLIGTLTDVPWTSGMVSLKVALDAGSGFVNLGTTPLESVPFSFYAHQVADLENHVLGDLADVDDATPDSLDVLQFDGEEWAPAALSFDQPWERNGSSIFYNGLAVGIRTSSPTSTLTVRGNQDLLDLTTSSRTMRLYGSTVGALETYGPNNQRNAIISWTSGDQNNGFMGIFNPSAEPRAYMEIVTDIGRIVTRGPADTRNTSLTWLSGCDDCGYIGVYDANSLEAGMFVNTSGQGVVFGDVKNFRMEHPTQPGKEIWYASLEGPEAAAYARGTAQLVAGRATVELPEHFALVAAEAGLTVILTPLSGSSKGLAVVQKGVHRFSVVELMEGTGNYAFDWEIKAVRQGFEDYRVIRDADESRPGETPREAATHEAQPFGEPFND